MGMSATNESLQVHAVKQKGQGRRSTHRNTYSDKQVPKYMSHVNVQRGIGTVTGVV